MESGVGIPRVMVIDSALLGTVGPNIDNGQIPPGTILIIRDQLGVAFLVTPKVPGPGNTIVPFNGIDITAQSGTDLSADQYKFATIDANGRVQLAQFGNPALGVIQNVPLAPVGSSVVIRTLGLSQIHISQPMGAQNYVTPDIDGGARVAVAASVAIPGPIPGTFPVGGSFATGFVFGPHIIPGGHGSGFVAPFGLVLSVFS